MTTYAIIRAGKVENLVVWDGDPTVWVPETDTIAVQIPSAVPMAIGASYANGVFTQPEVPRDN